MVSVPDYDPNNPREALDPTRINRLTTGVYEMGSTFKALTLAMALDSGRFTLKSSLDARAPLQYGKFAIHDYHPQSRMLTPAGSVHLFVEHRHGADGADARRRAPQGVSTQARPARPAAHRTAGKRRAARSEALVRAQHRHHRLRPRAVGRAAAGDDGASARWSTAAISFRRPSSSAAKRRRRTRQAGDQARHQREDALSDAAQCREGHGEQGRRQGLLCRRQDRHRREGGRWGDTPRPSC